MSFGSKAIPTGLNNYIIVHPRKKLAGLTNTTTTSDCQTPSGQLPGDKPGKNIR